METELQRLARELTIMDACDGPLSDVGWAEHASREPDAIQPTTDDLQRLAGPFGGSVRRARQFLSGLSLAIGSFAARPDAAEWRVSSSPRHQLDDALYVLAAFGNTPAAPDAGPGGTALTPDAIAPVERASTRCRPVLLRALQVPAS